MNELVIKALTLDSRQVKPGDLFMAVPGLSVDGRDYIDTAIQNGAVAVLVEYPDAPSVSFSYPHLAGASKVPIIPVSHLKTLVGHIAARFFSEPSKEMSVIGITGTNGKTSISHFIAQIFSYCGKPCAVMGSLGTGFLDALDPFQGLNTADAITLQKKLREFKTQGTNLVAMEVTSHGLDQNRVEGVQFHTAIFTNLTRDHLDYHGDMQHYAAAKRKLFTEFQPKYSIINLDDEFGQTLVKDKTLYQHGRKVIGYTGFDAISLEENKDLSFITTHNLVLNENGIHAFIRTPWGEGELTCPLFGRFNLSNILAALAAVCTEGVPLIKCLEAIKSIKTVAGRMMRFGGKKDTPLVVVDYAHTPDALGKILESVRQHCLGKIWCVFGCGGDRDRGKRPLMAAIAEKLSDHLCLTQDNPRTEDPKQIFNDMLQGLQEKEKVMLELDRRRAIERTINAAKPEDVVVIAGKGHEEYQIIGTQKIPFSDQVEVETLLARRERCVR